MEIKIQIQAPELAKAIESLAAALSGNKIANTVITPTIVNEKQSVKDTAKQEVKNENAQEEKKTQPEKVEDKPAKSEDKPSVTIEAVRSALAKLSQAGKQAQVKELISKFGAKKLTEVDPSNYADLLEAAEEIA